MKNIQKTKFFLYIYEYMLIVKIENGKNIDSALKILKSKVQKTKLIQELRSRKEYVKPSITKRKVKLNAVYVSKMKNGL